MRLSNSHNASRNRYIRRLLENRALPSDEQLCEVYSDESYLHDHYQRDEHLLYGPNDDQDIKVRAQHKGRRYCIVAAIQSANPHRAVDNLAGLDPYSLWTFCQKKYAHAGDYN